MATRSCSRERAAACRRASEAAAAAAAAAAATAAWAMVGYGSVKGYGRCGCFLGTEGERIRAGLCRKQSRFLEYGRLL